MVEGTTIVTKFGNPTRQVRWWIGFEDLEKEEEEDQTSDTNSRTVAVNRPCLRTLGNVDARRKLSTNEIKFHSVAIHYHQLSSKNDQTRDLTDDNSTVP